MFFRWFFAFCCLNGFVPTAVWAQSGTDVPEDIVSNVEVVGTRNDREEELVRALLGVQRGQAFDLDKTRQSLRRLMSRGYYRNVGNF